MGSPAGSHWPVGYSPVYPVASAALAVFRCPPSPRLVVCRRFPWPLWVPCWPAPVSVILAVLVLPFSASLGSRVAVSGLSGAAVSALRSLFSVARPGAQLVVAHLAPGGAVPSVPGVSRDKAEISKEYPTRNATLKTRESVRRRREVAVSPMSEATEHRGLRWCRVRVVFLRGHCLGDGLSPFFSRRGFGELWCSIALPRPALVLLDPGWG